MSTDDVTDAFPRFLPRMQDGPARFDEQVERLLGMKRSDCEKFIAGVAWRLTGNNHDASDLAQKAWMKILGYSFNEPVGKGWIVRVVTNTFVDDSRKRIPTVGVSQDVSGTLEFTEHEDRIRALVTIGRSSPDDVRRTREAIDRLIADYASHLQNPEHKLVAERLFDLGSGKFRSLRTIALETGLNQSKVQRTAVRIKAELRTILAPVRDELEALRLGLPLIDPLEPDSDPARTA